MLLPGGRLDGSDDLPGHAELRKGTEGRKLVIAEVTDGFVKANHTFLYNILPICTNEEVRTGFCPHKITVLVDEIIKCRLIVIILDLQQDFLIREISKFTIGIFQCILHS